MSQLKSKKYYWLKLKDDFFDSREIRKLRKIAGGDTYTIIYLKIQLLSIKKDGLVIYEGTEENIAEQLSLELDEDEDNIKMTLAFMQANKLIEQIHNDEYLLTKVPELIGSETTAAERMRRMREKNRNIVTLELQGVTESYTEKREEKRKEKREELDKIKEGEEKKKKTPAPTKKIYGEFSKVKLLDEEYNKLLENIGKAMADDLIVRLDSYKASTGKAYKSDYATILNWSRKEGAGSGGNKSGTNSYDTKNEKSSIAERAGVTSL